MSTETDDLLEIAMYQEIAAQALYSAGQKETQDAGAIALMQELAVEEAAHLAWLNDLKTRGLGVGNDYDSRKVAELRLSDYLSGGGQLSGAGLQDTLTFAIKKEQQAVDFYSRMMGAIRDRSAKRLCQRLVRQEIGHKYKLEVMYDDMFYRED